MREYSKPFNLTGIVVHLATTMAIIYILGFCERILFELVIRGNLDLKILFLCDSICDFSEEKVQQTLLSHEQLHCIIEMKWFLSEIRTRSFENNCSPK